MFKIIFILIFLANYSLALNFIKSSEENFNLTLKCEKSIEKYKNSLKSLEIWALEMFDAQAKLPSGILSGNLNNFGDFDECLASKSPDGSFGGKFCLASIMFDGGEFLEMIKYRILATEAYVSEFSDISHVSPKTSEIKWATCLPSTCEIDDVRILIAKEINEQLNEFNITVKIDVKEEMCQIKKEKEEKMLNYATRIVIFFFTFLIGLILLATFLQKVLEIENQWINALSLTSNLSELMTTNPTPSDMQSVHFIRSICSIILFFCHKAYYITFNPIAQNLHMNEMFMKPFTTILRIGHLYTDIFLMLSGFLVAHSIIKKRQKGEKIQFFTEILNRYIRLIPTVGSLTLFKMFILPQLGEGPLWPIVIDYEAKLCRKTSWMNFLMIQNFLKIKDICQMHTHHIATDFQLSMIGPILAVGIVKNQMRVSSLMVLGSIFVMVLRFLLAYFRGLSVFVSHGTRLSQFLDSDSILHTLSPYRITPYLLGIFLAHFLIKYKKEKLTDFQLNTGWLLAVLCFVATSAISSGCYEGSKLSFALFGSFGCVVLCFFVGWIIFTSELGYKNFFSPIIEWKFWKITANLSYPIYLVQFSIFHYNIGVLRGPLQFNFFGTAIDINEIFMVIFAAIFLTIFIDFPCRNIKKILTSERKEKKCEIKRE